MIKTDSPVRAHSEQEESYKAFTKDKRTRTFRSNDAVYSSSPRDGGEERTEKRHSYNPNFTRDNQLTERNRRQAEFRSERGHYGRSEGERNYNREGGYQQRERSFNREERNFNREERPYGQRERSFNREGGFKRAGAKPAGRKPFGERRSEPKPFVNTANHYTLENYPSYDAPQQEGAIRLNRYISMSGICSRREADEYITRGEITVNGAVVTELGSKVMPGDVVCYNGEQIQNEKKVYIVMNKPKGFVTTLDDPHADKSVMDLVKNACTERIYPVGRLDKNSVGVLLLTNDGDLAKRLTHPTYEKKKIYQVSLDKHLTRADMEQMILGITLEDGDIAADDICYVDDPKMKNAVGIEIHSGRNRIVRRMFEHMGYHVGKLDRVYFAGLTKQKLKRGEWRFLTEKEVAMLKSGSYE